MLNTTKAQAFTRLPDCDLPEYHPAHALRPLAFQCLICKGISFHPVEPDDCPYCNEYVNEDGA